MSATLITGGNSAIGEAVVKNLLERGKKVYATYHSRDWRIKQIPVSENLRLIGPFDISDPRSILTLVNSVDKDEGIEGVVNLASYATPDAWNVSLLQCPIDVFQMTFVVDVVSVLRLIQGIHPLLTSPSSVVLFGSAGAAANDLDTAVYNPAKEALASLAQHLSKLLSPQSRVNTISPGSVASDWLNDWPISELEFSNFKARRLGLGRIGEPHEVAELVEFLLSSRSAYINAQNIAIDGGCNA